MKMNLSQILALVDLNKPSYDARRRDKQLGFMQDFEAYLSNHEGVREHETKRNRYSIEHAVGLAVFQRLMERGLSTVDANYIVTNQFALFVMAARDGLVDFDQTEIASADPYHMGILYFSEARKMHVGGPWTQCVAEVSAAILEGKRALHEGDVNGARYCIPTELVLVNVTETYRTLRERLLAGLGL